MPPLSTEREKTSDITAREGNAARLEDQLSVFLDNTLLGFEEEEEEEGGGEGDEQAGKCSS